MHKVMVVDDEVIISAQLERRLSLMGYSVVGRANSGERSVSMAENLRPDIILMDIVMPGKMDGIDAAGRIRAEMDIPIIFVTAYADDQYLSRAKQVQPYGYILKPFHEREVRAAIEIALSRKERERELSRFTRQLEAVVDMFEDAVVSLDETGAIVFWNRKAQALSGYTSAEVLGRHFSAFLRGEEKERLEELYFPGISGDRRRTVERRISGCRLVMRDGSERIFDLLLFAHRVGDQRFTICILCPVGSAPESVEASASEAIVSICSYCCKIRSDHDEWLSVPEYLAERCGIRLSHGICPACMETYYPDIRED